MLLVNRRLLNCGCWLSMLSQKEVMMVNDRGQEENHHLLEGWRKFVIIWDQVSPPYSSTFLKAGLTEMRWEDTKLATVDWQPSCTPANKLVPSSPCKNVSVLHIPYRPTSTEIYVYS